VPSSPAAQPEIGKGVGARDCVSLQTSVNVQANMIQSDNGQLSLAKRSLRSRIPSERWEQIKVAYVSGIGLREIARKLDIPEGTVLGKSKRNGWTQQIQVATQQQSDAIIPVQSAPQSLVAILSERKGRTRLGLSKYAAEAAERAGESDGDLALSRNVRDVAAVHSTLWPDSPQPEILNVAVLIGQEMPIPPGEESRTTRPEKIKQIEGKEVAE